MMHRAWSSIIEVPYCLSRSSIKFQGHTALKIVEFDQNWAFPDCNSSLNSPMAMKCYTKLETAKERCPIVFQGHPSNFKVTRYKTSPILTQIGRFRTIGQSQLSNPSDLPCLISPVNVSILHFKDEYGAQSERRCMCYSHCYVTWCPLTNDGHCRLTMPVIKGCCVDDALTHTFDIGMINYTTTIKHMVKSLI